MDKTNAVRHPGLPLISGNWEEIKYEISLSNVIQRDSAVFARKLEKNLHQFATEKEEQASILKLRR